MRAFFGDINIKDNGMSKPKIVLFDSRINADQMFVVYCAMKILLPMFKGLQEQENSNFIQCHCFRLLQRQNNAHHFK